MVKKGRRGRIPAITQRACRRRDPEFVKATIILYAPTMSSYKESRQEKRKISSQIKSFKFGITRCKMWNIKIKNVI